MAYNAIKTLGYYEGYKEGYNECRDIMTNALTNALSTQSVKYIVVTQEQFDKIKKSGKLIESEEL